MVWAAGALAGPVMFLTDAFGYATVAGSSLAASAAGAALDLAVASALCFRPGRTWTSALIAVLCGLYVVPSLLFVSVLGTPPWFLVLATLGITVFVLSSACLWQARHGRQ